MDRFIAPVRKYTDIRELTAELLREFAEKVYVHQAVRINGKRVQRIRIVWNCIGEFTPPIHRENEKGVADYSTTPYFFRNQKSLYCTNVVRRFLLFHGKKSRDQME